MMMQNNWWIAAVDHRISTALIFFALMLLLGNRRRKQGFALRAAGSLALMLGVSWCLRTVIDVLLTEPVLEAMGYSVYLTVMSLLFLSQYIFCYTVTISEAMYTGMLALNIYKLAWNTFKALASAWYSAGNLPVWGDYSPMGSLVSYLVYGMVCAAACFVYRKLVKQVPDSAPARSMMITSAAFMLLMLVLEFCGHVFMLGHQALFLYYLCSLLYMLVNFVVLVTIAMMVRYREDNEEMQRFISNKMQYYQMSREGIVSLQIRCHDLKHQIAAIRSEAGKASFEQHIARLEESIDEYGMAVDCGNETINIVLTEKNILCSSHNIRFSYVIDGRLFDFMNEMELYSLFGNALDNALESCAKVKDAEKRLIFLKAGQRNGMVVLHVENSFDEDLNMVDGMPVTTKTGAGHGFGLRSIQEIAEKYHGIASVQAEDHIFKLTVLLKP